MLGINDIKNIKFKKAGINGYKAEDVNEFLAQVEESFKALQNEKLELISKVKFLADKVSKYREDEESVRTALISAQKLADNSIKDAKKRSDIILSEAALEADKILYNAKKEVSEQQNLMNNLKKNVKEFRSGILSMYKDHIKMINDITADERLSSEDIKNIEKNISSNKTEKEKESETNLHKNKEKEPIQDISSKKFKNLKFGEEYDIAKDESPVGLFSKN